MPRQVFDDIREQTPYKLPMWSILIVGFVCCALFLIDFRNYYYFIAILVSPFLSLWFSVWSLAILLVWAIYYWFAGKILGIDISWRNWFGFACWTAVPSILGSVAALLIFKLSSLDPNDIYTSSSWFVWFGMTSIPVLWIPIPLIWTSYIAVNGFMSWTGKSLVPSLIVGAIPAVVWMTLGSLPIFPTLIEFLLPVQN